MKALNRVIFLLVIMFFMQGCSRPGKTVVEPEPDPFNYKFKAEDANLLGLSVTDAAGNSATEIEPGVYQFAENLVPETPIRFVSNNLVEAGTTFQDVDEDGELSGADLMYNVGFELNYIGNFSTPGDRQVFANPLTALIPATGIPSSGIAGLPEQVFEIAISAGVAAAPETPVTLSGDVEEPVNQVISRSVAILTALQESIVITEGQNDVAQSAAVQLLTELTDANLESGLSDLADFTASVQAAVELTTDPSRTAVVLQVATQVADMVSQTPATEVTFYEAVIVSVQENVSTDSTVDSVTSTLTSESFSDNNNKLTFAVDLANNIEESGGFTAFLNSLNIVPIPVGDHGQSLVDLRVNDFNLEFLAESEKIKLNAKNAFFDQSELNYSFEADLYGVKVDDRHAVLMTLNANETNLLGDAFEGTNPARLLALCWQDAEVELDNNSNVCGVYNANLEFYALATSSEICAANYDGAMIEQINTLNRQQISCN